MAEPIYEGLSLEVRHEPDYSVETRDEGIKERVELPGFLNFGVVVDGVFVTILRRKAAGLFADVKRAKAARDAEAAAAPPPPPLPPAQ
jgi:hypothetical protein